MYKNSCTRNTIPTNFVQLHYCCTHIIYITSTCTISSFTSFSHTTTTDIVVLFYDYFTVSHSSSLLATSEGSYTWASVELPNGVSSCAETSFAPNGSGVKRLKQGRKGVLHATHNSSLPIVSGDESLPCGMASTVRGNVM